MSTGQPPRPRARASELACLLHGLKSHRPLRVSPVVPAPTLPRARPGRWFGSARRLARHLQACWQSLRAGWARRRIERDTQAALRGLDGRVLRDLGLDRSQIPSVAAAVAGRGSRRGHEAGV